MKLTFTQCKQIAANGDLRDTVEALQDQPEWIVEPLDLYDILAVQQGGCASGAYMPAVEYYKALKTMGEYGDDVLEYIEDQLGELPSLPDGSSWSGMACFYLSYAVELWCNQFDLDGVNWD